MPNNRNTVTRTGIRSLINTVKQTATALERQAVGCSVRQYSACLSVILSGSRIVKQNTHTHTAATSVVFCHGRLLILGEKNLVN